jgi:PAS domain S-box-containing protein
MESSLAEVYFNTSPEAILSINHIGDICSCNPACSDLLIPAGDEPVGKNFGAFIDKPSLREFKKILRLLAARKEEELQFYVIKKDDPAETAPLKVTAKSTASLSDQFLFIIERQNKSDQSYRLYKLLAENAYDINVMFEDERLVYISPSIHDFLGYEPDQIKSLDDWHNLFHPDDAMAYLKKLREDEKARESSSFYTYRQRRRDGVYCWFETKISREFNGDGSIVSIATSVDITQRKQAEKELEHQKEFIEALFDTDPNVIYVRDGSGRMIYCNAALTELTGLSREEILTDNAPIFPAATTSINTYLEMEKKVIDLGHELLLEEQIVDKNGVNNYFQTVKKPLTMRGGDVLLLSISTNINKIKYYQRENEKLMKAKDDFFSSMSHEIRTPMNAIIGMTDLLLRRNPKADQKKLLQTLDFSAKNLLSLINDILDFSKIEAGKIELEQINFNLHELVDNIRMSFMPQSLAKQIKLTMHLGKTVPVVVSGDYIKLGQVLNNLLSNALKFTKKGEVRVSLTSRSVGENEHHITLKVKDTGIGIAAHRLEAIFDPFLQANASTSRKYGGTGLGLSITKNLVNIMGGRLSVASEEGVGSTFTITIPFRHADQQVSMSVDTAPPYSDVNWKVKPNILYVEDVPTNQYLVEEILFDWGISVDMASSGEEALKKIGDKAYDLVLMDIQLPGIDGFETTRRIRNMTGSYYQDVPVIALTASTSDDTRHGIYNSGMQDYLTKPLAAEALRGKILEHARLNGHIAVKRAHTDDTPAAIGDRSMYEKTDKLFQENIARYQRFLKLTIEEFGLNKIDLLAALKDNNITMFRQVRHRMRSLLSTFGMQQLDEFLEGIIEAIDGNKLSKTDQEHFSSSLTAQLDQLIESLTYKAASLKWQ